MKIRITPLNVVAIGFSVFTLLDYFLQFNGDGLGGTLLIFALLGAAALLLIDLALQRWATSKTLLGVEIAVIALLTWWVIGGIAF